MKYTIGESYIDFSEEEEGRLCIDMLYVSPKERGNRLGYRLLDRVKEYARRNGYESIGLYAYPQEENGMGDDALIEYYEGYGFSSISGDDNALMEMDV